MEEIFSLFKNLPDWAGSVPMWGIFGMVLIALIKTWPIIMERAEAAKQGVRGEYALHIANLKRELKECRDECDARDAAYREEIDALKQRINNEAWQRTQGEISLVRTLIDVVEAPQLKVILEALQKQSKPAPPLEIHGPVSDTRGTGK